jgi:ketosteroid isomerase-like protein
MIHSSSVFGPSRPVLSFSFFFFLLVGAFFLAFSPAPAQGADLENLVQSWAANWSAGDFEAYRRAYAPGFTAEGKDLDAWVASREQRHSMNRRFWVGIGNLEVEEQNDNRAVVSFKQRIISSRYSQVALKELVFSRTDGGWKIVQERSSPVKKGVRYSVQLIPFQDRGKAESMARNLRNEGYDTYLYDQEIEDGVRVYALRLGDFKQLSQAGQVMETFCSRNVMYAYVTRIGSMEVERSPKRQLAMTETDQLSGQPVAEPRSEPAVQPEKETTEVEAPSDPSLSASPDEGRADSGPSLSAPQEQPSGPTLGTPGEQKQGPSLGPSQASGPSLKGRTQEVPGTLAREVQDLKVQVDKLQKEAEARRKLQITDEEKKKKEEQILEAAGREYTLLPAGTLGFEYSLGYSYYSFDAIAEAFEVEHNANHNLTNTLITEYAYKDNLTLNVNVPFVYKYNKVGTDDEKDVTDLGDVSLGVKYQPFKSGGDWPVPILNTSLTLPTSRGVYEINPETELSTGDGLYKASLGMSFSKPIDPVNAFASLNYTYAFEESGIDQKRGAAVLEEVEPGDTIGGTLGLGYALSYKVSLSLSWSYSYGFESKYHWRGGRTTSSGTSVSSSLNLSTGWRLSPKQSIILGVGVGLTDDNSDFSFSFRWPFEYDLR